MSFVRQPINPLDPPDQWRWAPTDCGGKPADVSCAPCLMGDFDCCLYRKVVTAQDRSGLDDEPDPQNKPLEP